jgi:hypothetical protein
MPAHSVRRSFRPAILAAFLSAILATIAATGCRDSALDCPEGPSFAFVSQLHAFCFCGEHDCETYRCEALLHLDTGNLPSQNPGVPPRLLLSGHVPRLARDTDRIELRFTGQLAADIDPGLAFQPGWKTLVHDARIEYCDVCYTELGLADVILLRGDIEAVEFVADPQDTLGTWILVEPLD